MKKSAIACSAIFFLSFHANAQTYLQCDFSKGIPADFTLIDNDGNTPSSDMANEGFAVGTPWIAATPKGGSGPAACSTSWYSPAGTSDDWMITPAITITDDNVILSWRAKASDKRNSDGYVVYISETGGKTIADFDKTKPLFSTDKESSDWASHSVSLDAYKGKTVSIAFVNNSTDKSRLYIDDITVAVESGVKVAVITDCNVPNIGETEMVVTASNESTTAIDGFDLTLAYDGETYTQHVAETLPAGESTDITLDKKVYLEKYKPVPFTVTISSGNQKFTTSNTLTSYQRHILCEEGTGTWCGYCVRGLVYVDSLMHTAADWAIPIAAHSGDPMYNSTYSPKAIAYMDSSGFPTGSINRKSKVDPSSFFTAGKKLFDRETVLVDIDVQATLDEASRTVASTTTLHFAEDGKDTHYGLAYVIVENNVHHPSNGDNNHSTNGYMQHNSYAGGGIGPMGGFENLDEWVSSDLMYYQCVGRGYAGDFDGDEGSVPADYEADAPITYEKDFTLPTNILDDANTRLVVILVDKSDNHVVNALSVPLGKNETTGIASIAATPQSQGTTRYYNINGTQTDGLHQGLNIVRRADGKTVKIMVKK